MQSLETGVRYTQRRSLYTSKAINEITKDHSAPCGHAFNDNDNCQVFFKWPHTVHGVLAITRERVTLGASRVNDGKRCQFVSSNSSLHSPPGPAGNTAGCWLRLLLRLCALRVTDDDDKLRSADATPQTDVPGSLASSLLYLFTLLSASNPSKSTS